MNSILLSLEAKFSPTLLSVGVQFLEESQISGNHYKQ